MREINLRSSDRAPGAFRSGIGHLLDVVANDAGSAQIKSARLARIQNPDHVARMTGGSQAQKEALAEEVMASPSTVPGCFFR